MSEKNPHTSPSAGAEADVQVQKGAGERPPAGEQRDVDSSVVAGRRVAEVFRELAHRSAEGLDVTLLWYPRDDRLSVEVNDTRTGDAFELAANGQNALEVFNHPYAYAAYRGMEVGLENPTGIAA